MNPFFPTPCNENKLFAVYTSRFTNWYEAARYLRGQA